MLPFDIVLYKVIPLSFIYVYINKSFFKFFYLLSYFTFDLICIAQVDLEFASLLEHWDVPGPFSVLNCLYIHFLFKQSPGE